MSKQILNDKIKIANRTADFFENFINISSDGILVTDLSQNIILANKMFCSFFHSKYSDIIETNLYEWLGSFAGNAIQKWGELDQIIQVKNYCMDIDFTISIDDNIQYFSVSASFLQQSPVDELSGIVSIWHNITAQKENEEKIKHLASFPEMNINPILEINESGEITYCNQAAINATQKLGFGKDTKVLLPADIDEIRNILEKQGGGQLYRETEIGDTIFAERLHFVPEINVIRIYTTDITARRKKEIELEEVRNQLVHSAKLSAIGKLSASIAHEFNNPICGIRNVLQMIQKAALKRGESSDNLIDLAIEECDRMADLVRKLRDFYRPSEDVYVLTGINTIIDEVLLVYGKRLKERKIKLEKDFSNNIPKVNVVIDQVKQVILNIVQNADDSILENNGQIFISTDSDQNNAFINIKDNGGGISAQNLSTIFEPFFTTKPSMQGTGLGLSISYGIIKKHKGDILVKSESGKGTTFTIIIPVVK